MKRTVCILSAAMAAVLFSATLENDLLQVRFDDRTAAFDVTDRRTGRVWCQMPEAGVRTEVLSVDAGRDAVSFRFRAQGVSGELRGRLSLEGAEAVVTVEADPALPLPANTLAYPAPFRAERGQRMLLPHGCGFAFPVERTDLGPGFDAFPFWSRNMKMSTWGQYAERTAPDGEVVAAGAVQGIVETPADARMTCGVRGNGLRQAGVVWQPENGAWGYARTVRFVFFEKGAPMEMAARYRAEMKKAGLLRTFAEKRALHPKLGPAYDLLAGAPVVWYWEQEGDKPVVARRLKELGFRNFLFCGITRRDLGAWITAEEVREVAEIPGVLQTEYDIYTDLMEPAMLDKIDCTRPHWPVEAWDRDDIVRNPDGSPLRGWKVALKSDPAKPVVGCARLCEARAPRYMRDRIAKRLAEAPYGARFLDVTGTSVGTCANPRHPLTRRESAVARRRMFGMLADEFGLLCGTEDGLECYVPECDYLEGNFSAASYRVDGGRYLWKIYDETPEIIEKALDPATRVPFWEMVFHDCIVSTWYWTDYNNKFTKAWRRHDLLNAVTGTPPMYLFTRPVFDGIQEKLAESVKVATPAARETFGVAMTEYRWLTPDRLVQQSAFANGYRVTVNFGDRPYRMKDGSELPSHGARFAR